MNASTVAGAPVASMGDHAALSAALRVAWVMGRELPATDGRVLASSLVARTQRRQRAGAALARLAVDPAATAAERALASMRATQFSLAF